MNTNLRALRVSVVNYLTDTTKIEVETMLIHEELSGQIISASIEVHRELGPGLLESTYEECLSHELSLRGIPFQRQLELPVRYKGITLDAGYRIDILVDEKIILELKAVECISPLHTAQLITYLKLQETKLGLLLNFNVPLMKDGIQRIVH